CFRYYRYIAVAGDWASRLIVKPFPNTRQIFPPLVYVPSVHNRHPRHGMSANQVCLLKNLGGFNRRGVFPSPHLSQLLIGTNPNPKSESEVRMKIKRGYVG